MFYSILYSIDSTCTYLTSACAYAQFTLAIGIDVDRVSRWTG